MSVPGRLRGLVIILMTALACATASGQQSWRDPNREDEGYDGRFPFVRLRWDGGGFGSGRRGMSSAWNHDYPRAEINLARILEELTLISDQGLWPIDLSNEAYKLGVNYMVYGLIH